MRKLLCLGILLTIGVAHGESRAATNDAASVPWGQIGTKAGADYNGDRLAVTPTESGARLHCPFQRLDGEATSRGLWLTSTVKNTFNDRFRVTAVEIGRKSGHTVSDSQGSEFNLHLAAEGSVSLVGKTVRLSRPDLTEEYSVSMDGVRQDFIVEQAPPGRAVGELVVKLAVTGAKAETADNGVRLVLENSGRKIAYSRLRATDAKGKELPARIEIVPTGSEISSLGYWTNNGGFLEGMSFATPVVSEEKLEVSVNDADAVYPVRIDPTFSDTNWISLGGILGVDWEVYSEVVDGVGDVYVGGRFSIAGNVFANSVAKWNGSSWSALGSGIDGDVYALALSGTNLYVGGKFANAGGISASNAAKWNGSSWSPLTSGISDPFGYVNALAVSGTDLYVGGNFTNAGGVPASNIAKWNGSAWSALGPEPWASDEAVSALAVSGNTLFAGGSFDYFSQNGQVVYGIIYQWSGSSWSPVGTGLPYHAYVDVFALAASGTNLFSGGSFGTSGVSFVARWNGTSWSDLGLDTGGLVNSLAVSGTNLHVGGAFTNVGDVLATNIATWNGSSWSPLGSGISGGFNGPFVDALAVSGSNLYAGGSFYAAGNSAASSIAHWNGTSWSALGSGIGYYAGYGNAQVSALTTSGSNLFVGGTFSAVGNVTANNIAEWNGTTWSPLGMGITGAGTDGFGADVTALAVAGSNLFVGGDFSNAGGSIANSIAQWNGSSWSALGSGIVGDVYSLALSGTNLYVGGFFTNAGGMLATNIAQWNGIYWSALGSGVNGIVYALAASGTNLYAGGYFTEAGGVAATNIAIWNGTSWSSLGAGRPSSINALAVSGPNLYVGGNFGAIGGVAANDIAQWNGTSWSALGSGILGTLGPSVYALEVSGTNLFAAGNFSSAGGLSVNNIAEWNGNAWSAMGSGITGVYNTVYALSVLGSNLFAGGEFTTAGTNVSIDLAEALVGTPSPPTVTFASSPTNGEAPLTVRFTCQNVDSGGNTITQWNWTFGDGAISTNQNPTNVYANAGTYYPRLLATNSLGQTVYGSDAALPLTVNTPDCTYEDLVNSMGPIAYYRLNEPTGTTAYDFFGGHNGTYHSAAMQGEHGVPDPPFFGFETNNLSVGITNVTANSWVFAPFGTLGMSNVTFTAWIYPVGVQNAWAGIIYDRTRDVGGVSYNDAGMIGYTWGGNNSSTYNWPSGLIPPTNQWSFVAVTISPNQAVVYVYNTNAQLSATNAIAHTAVTTGNNWHIGNDAKADPGRTFNGMIDEVAIFPYSLTPTQVNQLYSTAIIAPQVTLTVTRSGQNVVIAWSSGILQSAPALTGPWTSLIGTNSTYSLVPIGTQQYFRVKLQ